MRHIIEEFLPTWVHGAKMVHVGDTGNKSAFVDVDSLAELGLGFDPHGKFPDVGAIDTERQWLVLIEAVTSHGPVDPKRREELRVVFRDSKLPPVFVTAFLSRKVLAQYIESIAWETEVWWADHPTHLMHFNGERFLGPYDDPAAIQRSAGAAADAKSRYEATDRPKPQSTGS